MPCIFRIIATALLLVTSSSADTASYAVTPHADGFRGIWFDLGQKSEFGSKYSGGLGTYTSNHVPMAHYVEKVNRTYFTWGGTPDGKQRRLHILVSYYDHSTGKVARPVTIMDKSPVDDPHDNGSMSIDEHGHLWIFVSGRSRLRPSVIYRSKTPNEINEWLNLGDSEFTYPQPWWFPGKGFLHTYTRYTPGRELFYRTSSDGITWDTERKLAGLEGHYQTSAQIGDRLITAFNRHPKRVVDQRTDLYYMETSDMGKTWTKQSDVTRNSPRNHSYARRPQNAHPDFYAYWADGNTDQFSESHLYYTNRTGDKVWHLPYNMTEDFAAPELVKP